MDRRKFIAGLGSLTAAGAAGIGTGAFSSAEAERTVDVAVTTDNNALLGLFAENSGSVGGLENDEYATVEGNQLSLRFDESSEVSDPTDGFVGGAGGGLGTDSIYYFDAVFGAASKSEEQLNIDVDWSGLDNPDSFYFYSSNTKPSNYDFSVPADHTNRVGNGITGGSFTSVGVAIKTPDTTDASWETGSVDIYAESLQELDNGGN
jgi:hypothetical protein